MKRIFSVFFLALVLIAGYGATPAFSSGSFFDSIQEAETAEESGTAGTSQPTVRNEAAPVAAATSCTPVKIDPQQVKIVISNVIQQIFGKNIIKLGAPIRTIFLPITGSGSGSTTGKITVKRPSSGTTITVAGPKIQVNNPISSGSTTIPGNPNTPPGNATQAATIQEQVQQEFGISLIDGDSKWSDKELADCLAVLRSLPPGFYLPTKKIVRDKIFMNNANILGYVRMGIPTVTLLDGATSRGKFRRTLVHEMTHTFQSSNRSIMAKWQQMFWSTGKPVPSSVTSYGNTQDIEDMAESVAEYWLNSTRLKSTHPERYDFIKEYVMEGREFY
jgi:hypothetical protein